MPYRSVTPNARWLHLSATSMWTKNVLSDLIELQLAHCVGSMDLLDIYFAIRAVKARTLKPSNYGNASTGNGTTLVKG